MTKSRIEEHRAKLNLIIVGAVLLLAILGAVFISNTSNQATNKEKLVDYSFKEIGLNIKLLESMQQMKYKISSPVGQSDASKVDMYQLSISQFTAQAAKCSQTTDKAAIPFTVLIKQNGQAPKGNKSVLLQTSSYYISGTGPTLPATDSCQKSAKFGDLKKLGDKLTSSVNAAVKNGTYTK